MNVGLMGWSTRQQRIAWQRIARAYRPDQAILAVCLNDIPELFDNLSRPPRWLVRLHERSALARLVVNAEGREIDNVERLFAEPDAPRVREAMDRFFQEVRALRREVEADGAASPSSSSRSASRWRVAPRGRPYRRASLRSAPPRGCAASTSCRRSAGSGRPRSPTTTT